MAMGDPTCRMDAQQIPCEAKWQDMLRRAVPDTVQARCGSMGRTSSLHAAKALSQTSEGRKETAEDGRLDGDWGMAGKS